MTLDPPAVGAVGETEGQAVDLADGAERPWPFWKWRPILARTSGDGARPTAYSTCAEAVDGRTSTARTSSTSKSFWTKSRQISARGSAKK
jgi:hypothetical protein